MRAPHYVDTFPQAVSQVLQQLSWPSLRYMWWVVASEPAAVPKTGAGFPAVAVRWIELASEGRAGMPEV